ncbi:trypsin-like serine protease [bacterium]|nr:trypsin-like serine protease [bacterium]
MAAKKNDAQESIVFHDLTGDPENYDYENITPKYRVLEQSQESICGTDQRIKVTATTAMPYKAICKIYMKAANGRNFIGTGWLTHANKLYTAGHCVYDEGEGGWMESIIVVPAMSGSNDPYGRYTASAALATNGWINDQSQRYDMGAIKLSSNVSHSDFILPTLSDSNSCTVCGYPGDRDTGIFQYRMNDSVRASGGRHFYQIDTFGGQSGAPLLSNGSTSIGIHNYGGCDNSGSDLYQKFIDAVDGW